MLSVTRPRVGEEYRERAHHAVVGVGPGGCAMAEWMAADRGWELDSLELRGATSEPMDLSDQDDDALGQRLCHLLEGVGLLFLVLDVGDRGSMILAASLARLARTEDTLTLALVRQSSRPQKVAEAGSGELRSSVDAMVVIPQDGLYSCSSKEAIVTCILAIVEVLTVPGLLRVDLADLEIIARGAGGLGRVGMGRKRGREAAARATHAALGALREQAALDSAGGGVLLSQVGEDFSLVDIKNAMELVVDALPSQALFVSNMAMSFHLSDKEVLSTLVVFGS